jgi:hypothetical protein
LIELLEYVLRNAAFTGVSFNPLPSVLMDGEALPEGDNRVGCPLDDPDDMVSIEFAPCSRELDTNDGTGGTMSAGANRPFLVVAECERELSENSPFAFGADATRRINRVAEAPTDLGESGPLFDRDLEGVFGLVKEDWEGCAVSALVA